MVEEIERRAETREFGRLQEIRKELKGLSRLHRQIFPAQSVFEDSDGGGYAFHYGGRKELQFNIGSEPEDRRRHGVAYSFERSQTLPEPELLLPSVKRFNEFLRLHPDQFSDMWMWHWDNERQRGQPHRRKRSSDYRPAPIQADLIRRGVFVFLGRMQPSDAIDYDLIMDDLDRLLPLYRFAEGGEAYPVTVEPTNDGFQFKSGCSIKPTSTTASLAERQLNIDLRHNELQRALHDHLAGLHGVGNVGTELASAGGQVDVVVRRGDKFWFYEIKTSMSARGCIREALAQLLEYSFWPGAQKADKLVIVGEPALDSESKQYIGVLREEFVLPIEYQQFDRCSGTIVI